MIDRRPYRAIPCGALAILAIAGLTGCAQDRESAVREELGQWLILGETLYFESSIECTAAVFVLRGAEIRETIPVVALITPGIRFLKEGRAVAFDVPDVSPSDISETIMSTDLPTGIGLLSSGVAAKNCMGEDTRDSYLAALTASGAVLIFDPSGNGLAVLDRAGKRVFFARGGV